jgi:hypothetical protein
MKQYVQTDLETDRQVANTLAELIIGGALNRRPGPGRHRRGGVTTGGRAQIRAQTLCKRPLPQSEGASNLVAGEDLNLRPLGYEHCDARLWRLGQALLAALTSVNLLRKAASGLPRLPYPGLSRRVSCTNPRTRGFLNWGFRSSNGCALRTLRPVGSAVTVDPPYGERARPHGSRWSALLDERPERVGSGLLGFAWADGDGVKRIPASAMRELRRLFPVPSWSLRSPPEA